MKASSTITRARAIAKKNHWPAEFVKTELDALAVIDEGCYFDPSAGEYVIRFFRDFLKHSIGEFAGQPFELQKWQKEDLILPLFSWKRSDGTRRFRRAGIWCAKKNGKTTLASGLCLYMLVGDSEPGAQIFSAGVDRSQAAYTYKEMAAMARQSPDLAEMLDPVDSRKLINYRANDSFYQALSADAPSAEGRNIHLVCVDELHAWKDRSLWSTLAYGGASRRQPLMISISTAGIYDPASIGWEQYLACKRVLAGDSDDWSFFPLIYESDEKDDWTKESTWKKANPSYGVTAKAAAFKEEAQEAQESPAKQNDFLRYRCSRWVQQNTRAIDLTVWDENHAHAIDLSDGRPVFGGLDLGGSSDLSAWVLLATCKDDPEAVDVLCRFWLPEDTLHGKHPNAGLYRQWAKAGILQTTPGNTTDERFIQRQIVEDAQRMKLVDGNIDRLFQGMRMTQELQEEGVILLPFGQGFLSLAAPTKKLLGLITGRRFHHGGNPILRWMADNVVLRQDAAGNGKFDKEKSAQKIDGLCAAVNAIDRWERNAATPVAEDPVLVFA